MEKSFEAAKWDRRIWAVFDRKTHTFSHIGKGRLFCEKKAKELNDYMLNQLKVKL